ncbi:NAD(P)-dependent alcohol dehydrogenase [Actinotalea sp.]|uniref:NAD(P)-dependent alcohol dehydrogenase n=1 Tax=Actinotalea sp. TaxID=1872145 RepID=UPI0035652EDD
MRAATYRRFGGPDVVHVEDVPSPTVGVGDVLVRVHASTVSAADRRARSLDVPAGLRLPSTLALGVRRPRRPVLGMDIAGTVTAVGTHVTRFSVGDEIIAMLGASFGGHAEYAVIDQDAAITAKPAAMSFEDAVTLVFGGITARAYLRQITLPPKARVLVNGASGAVGTAMVQLAKATGAHVTAVCSGPNADLVTRLGADRVVDYRTDDFTTQETTYDVVVDCVGNAPFARVRHLLNPGGALLLVVADLGGLLSASWHSRRTGHPVVTTPGTYRAEDLTHLVNLADTGHYQPVRETTVDLDDIADAHRLADTGHKRGNVVVRLVHPVDRPSAEDAQHTRHHPEGHRS